MQLTGDPRRLANEPGAPGFIKVMDPWPYHYSFGKTEEEITANNLQYLEEVIMYEGADKIAAMFIETVTGTNGILPPPKGYLKGLRALLDKYGILVVMSHGRMGTNRKTLCFRAWRHRTRHCLHGQRPDLLYIPLGAMGVSDPIAQHFQDNVFWGGLTYNSHALALATAEAVIDVMIDEGLVENAAKLGHVMRSEMDRLKAKHPSVREGRCIGLFGMIDVQKNSKGDRIAPYNGTHPAMVELNKFFRDNGLFTFVRWGSFMCNPPLCITKEQLLECFAIIDRGLEITDRYFEG